MIDEYLIQLRIATNPHLEADAAREFINTLTSQRAQLQGINNSRLDRAGLARLKEKMRTNSEHGGNIVVK
jgi:hypothetical protein